MNAKLWIHRQRLTVHAQTDQRSWLFQMHTFESINEIRTIINPILLLIRWNFFFIAIIQEIHSLFHYLVYVYVRPHAHSSVFSSLLMSILSIAKLFHNFLITTFICRLLQERIQIIGHFMRFQFSEVNSYIHFGCFAWQSILILILTCHENSVYKERASHEYMPKHGFYKRRMHRPSQIISNEKMLNENVHSSHWIKCKPFFFQHNLVQN